MLSQPLTVSLIQHRCESAPEKNLQYIGQQIKAAADQGAKLVLLQELHNSLYFCQTESPEYFDLAETIPGPSTEQLASLAREYNLVIVASLFEKRAAGLYHNTAVVLDSDGHLAGRYRKMHIPDDPGFYEKFYFTPGDLGFHPIETSVGKLGVLVCWDQWYPEAARLMALAGADLLLYPTAIGWDRREPADDQVRQREAWMTIQRSHAIANALPTLVCNRTGFEASPDNPDIGIDFWGSSFVSGPQGEIIAEAPTDEPCLLTATIEPSRTDEVRRMWPFLRDRRVDAYDELSRRFRD